MGQSNKQPKRRRLYLYGFIDNQEEPCDIVIDMAEVDEVQESRGVLITMATGRVEASDRAVEAIVRIAPTAEGHALAGRLWTMFGEGEKARALARRRQGA